MAGTVDFEDNTSRGWWDVGVDIEDDEDGMWLYLSVESSDGDRKAHCFVEDDGKAQRFFDMVREAEIKWKQKQAEKRADEPPDKGARP